MKWIFPIWNAFISICNDEAGPEFITKNNLELVEKLKQRKMSKIKEQSINNLTTEDVDKLYGISDMEYFDLMDEYADGKYSHLNPNSPNFDEELDKANPHYSENTIRDGIKHAFDSIQVTEDEVGREIFTNLFEEKLLEYIKSRRY
jgi:hypothetical protein